MMAKKSRSGLFTDSLHKIRAMSYTELQVTSNFSFLRGASHPEELVEYAAQLGYSEIAITDRNSFAGIVRAHLAGKKSGIRVIPGCRIDLADSPSLLALPTNITGYSKISNLLTQGNMRTEKGKCLLYRSDIMGLSGDIKWIVLPPQNLDDAFELDATFKKDLSQYKEAFGRDLYMAASKLYRGNDNKLLYRLSQLSSYFHIPLVATNDVHYHHPSRRPLQDVVTCIREKCTIYNAGFRLHANAERYIKPADEMVRLFWQYPGAIQRTQEIKEACQFSLDHLKFEYPKELSANGRTPQEELVRLTREGAKKRFGDRIPEDIARSINHELNFIAKKNHAPFFLQAYDIVRYANENKILNQGRGSAANSTVCYCLGVTAVDPTKIDLLFERFASEARDEPPDIDIDFEHERREEVMQYVFQKYGRDRAAIVATVTQQHFRGAVRDVGKVMGLSVDTINILSSISWGFSDDGLEEHQIIELGLNPRDPHLRKVLYLTQQFIGFPRQLGQHTGGFVITDGKLSSLCPILNARMEDRTCIEWNKDDIDALGFLKVDVLALGMLTCIRKAFDLLKLHYGLEFTLSNIPPDDAAVYDMISKADTIGVFQIESRAQQSMLPRLKPRCFYDLVIEVAIVRPGPIQGDMVHPYLRRRNGEEKVEYPSKELESILSRTLGVPLFQEQAMKIAMVAANFTGAEADALRKSMATFKAKGMVKHFEQRLIQGMVKKGYSEEYARRVFKQLEGFGSYGFPESHAASFAHLVYVSSWIKCHYPEVFACALLNSQPMGFYQPAQIVEDAKRHQVQVRPVDINYSTWDNLLEEQAGKYYALRLGFRHIKGFSSEDASKLECGRKKNYTTVNELRDAGISQAGLEKLAEADAFRSMGLDRRQALWEVSTRDRPLALFAGRQPEDAKYENIRLPQMSLPEHVVQDYKSLSLSLKGHPVKFIREKLEQLHIVSINQLEAMNDGDFVKLAGLILVRQRPETAKGICFMTIEDETGNANLVVWKDLFEQYRKPIMQAKLIMVEGKLQKEGDVIHVIVSTCHDFSKLLKGMVTPEARNFK
jgi:error-prone DNA polymerase